jgi:hypothetical protein
MKGCQGLTYMSKRDFYPMFTTAWEASFKKDTIFKAWEATGLSPFHPEVILKKFKTRQPTPGNSQRQRLLSSNRFKLEEN